MKKFNITVNGQTYAVEVEEVGGAAAAPAPRAAAPAPAPAPAPAAAPAPAPAPAPAAAPAPVAAAGEETITAPMPGKILKILKHQGDAVAAGENLMMLEAMKMQNEILSPVAGTVKSVPVSEGQNVNNGDTLAIVG